MLFNEEYRLLMVNKNEDDNSQKRLSKLSASATPSPTRGLPPNVTRGIMPMPQKRYQNTSAPAQANSSGIGNAGKGQNSMNYGAHSINLDRSSVATSINNSKGFAQSQPLHSQNLSRGSSQSQPLHSQNLNRNGFSQSQPLHSQNLNSMNTNSAIPANSDAHNSIRTNQSASLNVQQGNSYERAAKIPRNTNSSGSINLNGSFNGPNQAIPANTNAVSPGYVSRGQNDNVTREQIHDTSNSLLVPIPPTLAVEQKAFPQQIERRNIFKENPNVYYLNGESLSRPLTLPKEIKTRRWIFVGIAVLIASLLLFLYFDQIVSAPVKVEAQMNELLSQDNPINPPDLLKLLDKSDKKIKSSLIAVADKNDYSIIDITDKADSKNEMSLMKIPSGLTDEEGKELYSKGLNNLNAIQLVSLLYGGWDLNVNRTSGLNISLHYADFKSTTPTKAIAQAIAAEGLSRGTTSESGDDDGFGNAYSSGSIMIKGVDYAWTVSSTYLKNVYSANGIPDNATYVGIRVIKKLA